MSEHSPHSELIAQFERELIAARIDNARLQEQLEAPCRCDKCRDCVAADGYERLQEQKETLLAAVAEYVRVVKEHADALADYAEDMDGDAEQIVSSLGFIGNLDRGCLDPEDDSLAQALDVLRDSFPASEPEDA